MSFHSEGIGKDTTPELNHDRKHQRVLDGEAHAALVFDGADYVGWCQFGRPDELPKIKNRAAYERDLATAPDWRIACCFIGKGHRRQGVSAVALAGAVELIATLGCGVVEGCPEDETAPVQILSNGRLGTYEALGFTRQRQIGKRRWVVEKQVDHEP